MGFTPHEQFSATELSIAHDDSCRLYFEFYGTANVTEQITLAKQLIDLLMRIQLNHKAFNLLSDSLYEFEDLVTHQEQDLKSACDHGKVYWENRRLHHRRVQLAFSDLLKLGCVRGDRLAHKL